MTNAAGPASEPPRATSRGRFAALKHRDFTLLWAGNIVSRVGTQMRDVALAWQIYVLTHSPLKLGLIGAARVVPIIVLSLGGGVAADTFDRRRVMMTTQTILALTSTAMAVLTWRGWMTEHVIYGCIALSAAANAFDAPARQAIVTNVLPDEDLPNGLSLSFTAIQLATVIGPGLGGMMLELSSIEVIYAIDAISYLAVLGALATIRPRPRREADEAAGGARIRAGALGEGLRFLLRRPVLIWLMLLDFLATFFAGSLLLLPIFANEIFNVGKVGLGWLSAAPSMGAVLAGAWLSWRPPMRRYGPAVLGAVVTYGACVAAFGATSWLFNATSALPLALLFLAGSGAADTVSTVVRQVVRQTLTPDALRGRMTGVNMIFFIGGPQLGEVEAGIVAQLSSAQLSVVSGGIFCMVGAALLGAFVPVLRGLRAEEEKSG